MHNSERLDSVLLEEVGCERDKMKSSPSHISCLNELKSFSSRHQSALISICAIITNIVILSYYVPQTMHRIDYMQGQTDTLMNTVEEFITLLPDITNAQQQLDQLQQEITNTKMELMQLRSELNDTECMLNETRAQLSSLIDVQKSDFANLTVTVNDWLASIPQDYSVDYLPILSGIGSSGTVTYGGQSGMYARIGALATFNFYLFGTVSGNPTGSAVISLPYPAVSLQQMGTIGNDCTVGNIGYVNYQLYAWGSQLYIQAPAGSTVQPGRVELQVGSFDISGSITYQVQR